MLCRMEPSDVASPSSQSPTAVVDLGDDAVLYPATVKIQGLPLASHGWNSVLYRMAGVSSDGVPVYRMDPYTLYFVFPITGIELKRHLGLWGLYRTGDVYDIRCFGKRQATSSDSLSPLGDWLPDFKVISGTASVNSNNNPSSIMDSLFGWMLAE